MSKKGLPIIHENIIYFNLDEKRDRGPKFQVVCASLLIGITLGVCFGLLCYILVPSSIFWEALYREPAGSVISVTLPTSTQSKRTFLDFVDNTTIEEDLKYLTRKPHVAGTATEKANAEYVRHKWISQGLENVKIHTYDVLLSYPNSSLPSKVSILENGKAIFHTALQEKVLRPGDNSTDIIPPFNAYSVKGEHQGDLVYVNYARLKDFRFLKGNHSNINLNGTILLVRYGQISRWQQVTNAQNVGAKGVILFSDPADIAKEGPNVDSYPDGYWLPGTGVQRGSILAFPGDPLTPGYPAKPYMYHKPLDEVPLPKIPVHPIGYDDAQRLLSEMTGPIVKDWIGGLNVSYRIGPGFSDAKKTTKISVHTGMEERTIHNVVGMIKGKTEPDRYVILGNHRDAWVYGAIDPSSGTAALLEVTRSFGQYLKTGWRPRRTILFASWEAEEYGVIGSTEYAEGHGCDIWPSCTTKEEINLLEFEKVLVDRAVAYLNVDMGVSGNFTFYAGASPLLNQAIYDATKRVPDPEKLNTTLYESWLFRTRSIFPNATKPPILNLGSGSDFMTFMYRLGIPSADIMYLWNASLNLDHYPTYHSLYDTFYYMKTFIDPHFVRHKCVAQVWGEVARMLADEIVLPLNCLEYAHKLNSSMNGIKEAYEKQMKQHDITFAHINSALKNFTSAATSFHKRAENLDTSNVLAVRIANDQIMRLERAFIDQLGIPGNKLARHVVFGPIDAINPLGLGAFPGIVNAMSAINDSSNPEDNPQWEVVREQMAIAALYIQSAATTLKDVTATF